MNLYIFNKKNGLSKLLANFVYSLDYSILPAEVVHQAKRCLLDYLGVVLRGSNTQTADKIRDFLSKFNDKPEVTVFGYQRKTDLLKAALVNGITSHILELDDGHRSASVHPGSAIISAILSLIEKEKLDGKKAIVGLVAGYETALRIGKAIQPSHRKLGFHATATCGTFGAAMAASKILNLSEQQTSYALGIAGSSASGLLQFLEDGTDVKQYHPGKAALCGLLASFLAQSGLTSPNNILEGERGFLQAFSENINLSMLTEALGQNFAIMDIYFKPYAACRHCHAPIEAILNISRGNNDLHINNIEIISVFTYKSAVDGHSDPCPQNVVGAKMSIPYSVAVALKTGWAGPDQFEPSYFKDPEILNLAKKVETKEEAAFTQLVPDKRPALVEITMLDGRKFQDRVDLPKGEPENPLSDEEIRNKFTELASSCRSKEEIKKIIDIVENAEKQIEQLFPYLY